MSTPASRNRCPICAAATAAEHAPFCSRGCRDRDLLQWLGEGYRLPGQAAPDRAHDGLDTHESPD